jgi:hypothetical protein
MDMLKRIIQWFKDLDNYYNVEMKYTHFLGSFIYYTKLTTLKVLITKLDGEVITGFFECVDVPLVPDPLFFDICLPERVAKVELFKYSMDGTGEELVNIVENVGPGKIKLKYTLKQEKTVRR